MPDEDQEPTAEPPVEPPQEANPGPQQWPDPSQYETREPDPGETETRKR